MASPSPRRPASPSRWTAPARRGRHQAQFKSGKPTWDIVDADRLAISLGKQGMIEPIRLRRGRHRPRCVPASAGTMPPRPIFFSYIIAYDGRRSSAPTPPTGMADFFDVKKFPAALALQMGRGHVGGGAARRRGRGRKSSIRSTSSAPTTRSPPSRTMSCPIGAVGRRASRPAQRRGLDGADWSTRALAAGAGFRRPDQVHLDQGLISPARWPSSRAPGRQGRGDEVHRQRPGPAAPARHLRGARPGPANPATDDLIRPTEAHQPGRPPPTWPGRSRST